MKLTSTLAALSLALLVAFAARHAAAADPKGEVSPAATAAADAADASASAGASPATTATVRPAGPALAPATATSPFTEDEAKRRVRMEKLKLAREEMAQRYLGRRADAVKMLEALKACAQKGNGEAKRDAEKAATNLASGIAKADEQAGKGIYRKAFTALGRPQQAARVALSRCEGR